MVRGKAEIGGADVIRTQTIKNDFQRMKRANKRETLGRQKSNCEKDQVEKRR